MSVFQNDYTDNVKIYYNELKKCVPLDANAERELLIKSKSGDISARNKIVESNLRFVFDIARRFRGRGVSMSDLISGGNIGLMKAIERLDMSKDVKFITYAVFWVKERMMSSIKANSSRIDSSLLDDLKDADPNDDCNNLIKDKVNDVEDEETSHSREDLLDGLMCVLNDKEKKIMEFSYGLCGNKEMSFQEIGKKYHISSERVRQIKLRSLDKIRMTAISEGKFC